MQEADTTHEWDAATIARFLSLRRPKIVGEELGIIVARCEPPIPTKETTPEGELDEVVRDLVSELADSDLDGLSAYWEALRGVPSEFDKRLLGCGRDALERNLERNELRYVRSKFQNLVKARIARPAGACS